MKKELITHTLMVIAVLLVIGLIYIFTSPIARAVQPDEMLNDPQLEARAREISADLRCLVCQSESIDNSNADLAKTLRLLVRERLLEGDSNDEVIDYIVDRYGEFVLLKPIIAPHTIALWLAGPFALLVGGFLAWRFIQKSSATHQNSQPDAMIDSTNAPSLNDEEREKLDQLLSKE